jgi:REP-associated tyrosine transposase
MRRRYAPGQVPHHLVHRGNDRCCVFQTDEQRISYLSCLSHARWKYQCCIHAYVLMDNHVHLLATAAVHCGISRMMQWLGARYTTSFNESQGRTGTLWEGRFYSSSILSERYFLICQRYIELNPVRAGLVAGPADFAWSSYAHNALGRLNPLLSEHEIYRRLGPTRQTRCEAYRALFAASLQETDLATIRMTIHSRKVLCDPLDAKPTPRRGRPAKQKPESDPADAQLKIRL